MKDNLSHIGGTAMTSGSRKTNHLTRKMTTFAFLLGVGLAPVSSLAGDFTGSLQSVSITDSAGINTQPTATFTSTKSGDTFTFDATASTDPDGTITDYRWDFGDGTTATGVTATHQYTAAGNYPVTLTVVDDQEGVALYQVEVANGIEVAVNFQLDAAEVPAGYLNDSAQPFDDVKGYGWVTSYYKYLETRDRNSSVSPSQEYDTLILVNIPDGQVWEYALPAGRYQVTVCYGDPRYPNSVANVQIEQSPILVNAAVDSTRPWVENTIEVDITDGRLTMTFEGTEGAGQICWIKIKQL